MTLDDAALDALFRTAHTHDAFADTPVTDEDLQAVFALARLGPTSANCSPARFLVIRSDEAKEKLRPTLSLGNIEKTMAAPLTLVIAYDPYFHLKFQQLYPAADLKGWFAANPDLVEETGFRNSSLQGAYFMLAARALGLACGPMSGFERIKLDRAFFTQSGWKSNFLLNLGHPKGGEPPARLPRLTYEEAVTVA